MHRRSVAYERPPWPCRALVVLSLVGVGGPVGCDSRVPTQAYVCHCSYTTDTDVPGVLDVRVCVAPGDAPVGAAGECAVGMGVGHVEVCRCEDEPTACVGDRCEQAAQRDPALTTPSAK